VARVSATVFAGISVLLEVKAASTPVEKGEASLGTMDALIGAMDGSCFIWDASTPLAEN